MPIARTLDTIFGNWMSLETRPDLKVLGNPSRNSSLNDSSSHWLTDCLTHSFNYPFTHSLAHSPTHTLIHSLTHAIQYCNIVTPSNHLVDLLFPIPFSEFDSDLIGNICIFRFSAGNKFSVNIKFSKKRCVKRDKNGVVRFQV